MDPLTQALLRPTYAARTRTYEGGAGGFLARAWDWLGDRWNDIKGTVGSVLRSAGRFLVSLVSDPTAVVGMVTALLTGNVPALAVAGSNLIAGALRVARSAFDHVGRSLIESALQNAERTQWGQWTLATLGGLRVAYQGAPADAASSGQMWAAYPALNQWAPLRTIANYLRGDHG